MPPGKLRNLGTVGTRENSEKGKRSFLLLTFKARFRADQLSCTTDKVLDS